MQQRMKEDEQGMELIEVLEKISVVNRDNGKVFLDPGRLNVITSLLWNSAYRRINADGLFHLYAKHPAEYYRGGKVLVVSSHVDCQTSITRCFSRSEGPGLLKGTYDNAITNAAVLFLMLSDALPDNVLIAFTGDEEEDSRGAEHLVKFLRKNDIKIRHLFVLDATDMGWNDDPEKSAEFTVENNFWRDDFGEKIIDLIKNRNCRWRFVPSDPKRIPSFVPQKNVIYQEAEPDESWYYDEEKINCCSICLPVEGEMHSNAGVLAWEASFRKYTEILGEMLHIS